MRRIAAAHLIGNALILWLGYYWLGIGESRASTLVWSFTVAVVTAAMFCLLHGAGFVWGGERWLQRRSSQPQVTNVFGTAMRHLLPLLLVGLVVVCLYAALTAWANYSGKPAYQLASFLTLKLRKPVKPNSVLRTFNWALWFVRWVLVPVLILPAISAIAAYGWRGFAAFRPQRFNWRYWLILPLLLLAALWLPFRLMAWTPWMSGFTLEAVSVAIRGLLAYLLFVVGLLGIEFVCGDLRPKANTLP